MVWARLSVGEIDPDHRRRESHPQRAARHTGAREARSGRGRGRRRRPQGPPHDRPRAEALGHQARQGPHAGPGRRVGVGDEVAGGGVGADPGQGDAALGAIEQPVVVAVGIERVDQAIAVGVVGRVGLGAVDHAVVVGVGVVGVGAEEGLLGQKRLVREVFRQTYDVYEVPLPDSEFLDVRALGSSY